MIRGPDIQYHIGRKVHLKGEYTMDKSARDGFYIPCATTVKGNDGDTILLTSPTTITVEDRIVLLRPHATLFDLGLVSYLQLIDTDMGETTIKIRVELESDVELELDYLAKLYLF